MYVHWFPEEDALVKKWGNAVNPGVNTVIKTSSRTLNHLGICFLSQVWKGMRGAELFS